MLFNNCVPIKGIVYPEALKNKLQFAANCALSEKEVQCFSQALILVASKMEEDMRSGKLPPKIDNLRRATIIFTENGELSFSGIDNEIGINISLIVYKMKPLRYFSTHIFSLFVFIEEMAHHFWSIEDETLVKHKVVEILQQEYKNFTIDIAKEWFINGFEK